MFLACVLLLASAAEVGASRPATDHPKWVRKSEFLLPCDDAFGGCTWTLEHTVIGSNLADAQAIPAFVIVQRITRVAQPANCGGYIPSPAPFDYYEYIPVRPWDAEGSIEDTLSSYKMPHDVFGTDFVVAEAKCVDVSTHLAVAAEIDAWFGNDSNAPKNYVYDSESCSYINLLHEQDGTPMMAGNTQASSGRYVAGPEEPVLSGEKNWSNNFGGVAISMPLRAIVFGANCCDAPGFSTLRCIR